MKKILRFPNLLILTLLLITFSCSKDDEVEVINLQDLEVTIDENQTIGQVIGTVQSDSSSSLTYSITTESPSGALSIDASTGELTIADASLFDFEINPVITATVSADEAQNTAAVIINLNNINEIGDFNYGGIVFWINPTDDTKGLVCAVEDQSTSIKWHNTQQPSVAGTSENIETGSANTDAIITSLGTNYAAGVARAYNGGGFSDWFLPSVDELIEMSNNRAAINTTATANSGTDLIALAANVSNGYWSSSKQTTNGSVYLFNILTGSKNGGFATNNASVRAVRSF